MFQCNFLLNTKETSSSLKEIVQLLQNYKSLQILVFFVPTKETQKRGKLIATNLALAFCSEN